MLAVIVSVTPRRGLILNTAARIVGLGNRFNLPDVALFAVREAHVSY